MSDKSVAPYMGDEFDKSESGSLAEQFAPTGLSVYSTFDTHTRDGATRLLQATMGESIKLRKMIGKKILVDHFYAHEVESVDEKTGESKAWIRTVLFSPDGKSYDCGALGVRKSISIVAQIRGPGYFNPPIEFDVIMDTTAKGRNWLYIKPDVEKLLASASG